MGPMQGLDGVERTKKYIDIGLNEGAKLVIDGRTPEIAGDYPKDYFINPNVFEGVSPDMTIAKEEIFGPVANILRAKDLDEAITMINNSNYGNAASLFTSSGPAARDFQYRVECGNIGINIGIVAPMAFFPFSGMKDSFYGILHGQGRDAVRFFTESKISIQRWF
jgi:malonate-semialdehyde dehydrogenase (acetylating)/methylmalonate-semialdehyde dehydrogenase